MATSNILSLVTNETGQIGENPRRVKMITADNLATITTAGYLNTTNLGGQVILPTDILDIQYSYNTATNTGTYGEFLPTFSNGVITLNSAAISGVTLPTIANHIATYTNTTGHLAEDPATAISGGNIQAGLTTGTAGTFISCPGSGSKGTLIMAAVANTGNTNVTVSNAAHGQASVYSIPDSGASTANFIVSKTTGTQHITVGSLQVDAGSVSSGISTGGTAGGLTLYPATASNGSFVLTPVGNAGNFACTVSPKSTLGQASTITIPDPGAATANFVLDAGTATSITATTANITNLKYGATPVPQVDPASCTITAAAGASNTANITIQLKDGSGTNMTRSLPFKVYASSAADGLTLASAASTGFSVTSGGCLDPTGSTTITQGIAAFSSATGGCVLALLDTAKQTSYLVLTLANGKKISAQLTSGSYGA